MADENEEDDLAFDEWLKELDRLIESHFGGLTHSDFPDCELRDWFDSGLNSDEAFEEWLEVQELRIDRRDYDDEGD